MLANNRRYDLSDRLIHFFRDLDVGCGDCPALPRRWGHSTLVGDGGLEATVLLRHAIREGKLWATWSKRGGRPTIYGPRPAVCFTDMPLAAFLEASHKRSARGQAMGRCAVMLPKAAAFAMGARPVVYGLSAPVPSVPNTAGGARLLPESSLPLAEQFRYLAYDPTRGTLDWSHEREWRWPLTGPTAPDGALPLKSSDLRGINLDDPRLSGLGLIVETKAQARMVIHDVLTKVDRGDVAADHYAFVLVRERLPKWRKLREPAAVDRAVRRAVLDLPSRAAIRRKKAARIAAVLDRMAEAVVKRTRGGKGGQVEPRRSCRLWLADNDHEFTRALLKVGLLKVDSAGRYLLKVRQFDNRLPLRQRERMIAGLARKLQRRFGIRCAPFLARGAAAAATAGGWADDELIWNFGGGRTSSEAAAA